MKGLAILVSKGRSWRRTFVFFFKTTNNIHMNCKKYHRKKYIPWANTVKFRKNYQRHLRKHSKNLFENKSSVDWVEFSGTAIYS